MPSNETSPETAPDLFRDGSVTVAGLRAEYGLTRSVAYELMSAGRLPYTTVGRKRLVPRVAVARLLAIGLVGGTSPEAGIAERS